MKGGINRDRANKAIARMRKALRKAWRKHDELLLKYARANDELGNALLREKHYLQDFYRLKGVDFSVLEKNRKQIEADKSLERRFDAEQKRCIALMNKNGDLWLQLSKLPGGLEQARRIGKPI